MHTKELGRGFAVIANILISLSLFSVLVWWKVSFYLFAAGAVLSITAWLMDDRLPVFPSTAQE